MILEDKLELKNEDYEIKIKEGMPHAYPVFTFLKEGREGEREIIADINRYFESR